MPFVTGSFSGKITQQSALPLTDQPNHNLSIGEVTGTQESDDPLWNDANITYWAITDLIDGEGSQRGYYNNVHGDKGHEWGTFEGKVTGGGTTVEGTWKITAGDGEFGGVTGSGNFKTLIGVELVDARDKTHVWGEQYNRKASDILQIQSEISREIAEKLRLRLTANARQQLAKPETTSPQAYERLLRARSQRDKGGPENVKKAIEFLNQAIAFDPGYAPAYAELSEYSRNLVVMSVLDPKVGMLQAEAAARKALELDDSLANSHYAWAGLKLDAWDWATAEKEFRRTIELNPNLARAHAGYSRYLSVMGRHEQAIAEMKRTKELDPLSPLANTAFGQRLRWARQYDQAMEELKKTLELNSNFPNLHLYLGHVYMAKGQYLEAIAAYEKASGLGGETPVAQIYLGTACARGGQRERAKAILKRLQATNAYVSPAELAVLHDALGEREQAFASLEKAYAAHDLQLQFIGVDSAYDSLRNDPRFKDLVRRVGLPEASR